MSYAGPAAAGSSGVRRGRRTIERGSALLRRGDVDRAAVRLDDRGRRSTVRDRRRRSRGSARGRPVEALEDLRGRLSGTDPARVVRPRARPCPLPCRDADLHRRRRRACGRARCRAGCRSPGAAARVADHPTRPSASQRRSFDPGSIARAPSTASRDHRRRGRRAPARAAGPGRAGRAAGGRRRARPSGTPRPRSAPSTSRVLGSGLGAPSEQLRVAADRGERRPQLVRGVGDEPAEPLLGARRSSKAASIWASIALSASPSRPTSVRSSAGSTRRVRSPAAIAPAVSPIPSSGRRPTGRATGASAGHERPARSRHEELDRQQPVEASPASR